MKQTIELSLPSCMPKTSMPSDEAELRVQRAAAYRLIDRFEGSELIEIHISARLAI